MPYCERCNRDFRTYNDLYKHEAASSSHNIVCHGDDCHEIDFPTRIRLKEHWVQSLEHSYCQHCDIHFEDDEDLSAHNEAQHAFCRFCRKAFKNAYGLKEHYRQSPVHHFCVPCDRLFHSANNLESHLNSSVHTPKNSAFVHTPTNVRCPFRGCGLAFVSTSALILHLESGACQSGMDRATINREVRRLDTSNIITDPSRLLTGSTTPKDTTYKYFVTEASWNGSMFECYLCHKTYRTLHALNQHLASPRHQDKVYVCPMNTCRVRFTTLSALCQHIESEKCGVAKFAQPHIDRLVGRMGLLTM